MSWLAFNRSNIIERDHLYLISYQDVSVHRTIQRFSVELQPVYMKRKEKTTEDENKHVATMIALKPPGIISKG